MNIAIYLIIIVCVAGIATGQLLFKLTADLWAQNEVLTVKAGLFFLLTISIYGFFSLVWIWILKKMSLGQAYPFMALSFIFVPIGSYLFFNERFSLLYFIGIILIMVGIIIIVKT